MPDEIAPAIALATTPAGSWAQEEYWRLRGAKDEAYLDYSMFCLVHSGETFKEFNPKWFEDMVDPNIQPLFPHGGLSDRLKRRSEGKET